MAVLVFKIVTSFITQTKEKKIKSSSQQGQSNGFRHQGNDAQNLDTVDMQDESTATRGRCGTLVSLNSSFASAIWLF